MVKPCWRSPERGGTCMANAAFLDLNRALYAAARPLIFLNSAQRAHERTLELLRWLDHQQGMQAAFKRMNQMAFDPQMVCVGGVTLPYPLILAAGFVKGDGFPHEAAALAAVEHGHNVIPGWRTMPALVGPVEFGSFTRWPRTGNPGTVVWRDAATRSTQNRVGLCNPGARAAAQFLAARRDQLPPVFGINIAVSPGVKDSDQETDVLEALSFFTEAGLRPAWYTLNLSCPNTEDDPGGRQTEALTRELCGSVVNRLGAQTPLWVKISPGLADEQYAILMRVFAQIGVRAAISTNTLAQPAPDGSKLSAGVGGGRLHECAVAATIRLNQEKSRHAYPVDVIGCGGIVDGATYHQFQQAGAQAMQYWSALIYRGPLAAALILDEVFHA